MIESWKQSYEVAMEIRILFWKYGAKKQNKTKKLKHFVQASLGKVGATSGLGTQTLFLPVKNV